MYGGRPAALRPPARRVRPRLLATDVVGPAPSGNGPGELRLLPTGPASHILLLANRALGVCSLCLSTELGTLGKKLVVE